MPARKWLLVIINLIGGTAVLGSYVYGFQARADAGQILWGGVPQVIRPYYTIGMFLAATGYFAFTYFILFRLPVQHTKVAGKYGFSLFNVLYIAILVPSALWLPLSLLAVEQSSQVLGWVVRIVLAVVAVASLGLFFALHKVQPRQPVWAHRLSLLGSVGFCFQTVLLDAILWGVLFRV